MGKEPNGSGRDQYDIFIANTVYPEAANIFRAHMAPLDSLKETCLVVLDTNVLLLPYGTGQESLQTIAETYRKLAGAERLVMPGQVAREFARNRAIKLMELFQQIATKARAPNLHKGNYPLLESLQEYQQLVQLESTIDESLKEYRRLVRDVTNRIRQWTWNDPVSLIYSELFTDKVVFDPDLDRQQMAEDLNRRQLHSIPPGFKDAGKDDRGIGDLLIWHTILELGRLHKQDILFVTGDEKSDWFHRSENQALYPRFELVDEYRRISEGKSFYIISFSRFLDLFGVNADVVQEVRDQESQEQRFQAHFGFLEDYHTMAGEGFVVEESVHRWLQRKYPNALIEHFARVDQGLGKRDHGIDLVVFDEGAGVIAVEVKYFRQVPKRQPLSTLSPIVARFARQALSGEYNKALLVLVASDNDGAISLRMSTLELALLMQGVEIVVGYFTLDGEFEELETFDRQIS